MAYEITLRDTKKTLSSIDESLREIKYEKFLCFEKCNALKRAENSLINEKIEFLMRGREKNSQSRKT
mgnify:FL=1